MPGEPPLGGRRQHRYPQSRRPTALRSGAASCTGPAPGPARRRRVQLGVLLTRTTPQPPLRGWLCVVRWQLYPALSAWHPPGPAASAPGTAGSGAVWAAGRRGPGGRHAEALHARRPPHLPPQGREVGLPLAWLPQQHSRGQARGRPLLAACGSGPRTLAGPPPHGWPRPRPEAGPGRAGEEWPCRGAGPPAPTPCARRPRAARPPGVGPAARAVPQPGPRGAWGSRASAQQVHPGRGGWPPYRGVLLAARRGRPAGMAGA